MDDLSLLGLSTPIELWIITTTIQVISVARWTWALVVSLPRRLRRLKAWACAQVELLFRSLFGSQVKTMVEEEVDKRMDWAERRPSSRRRTERWTLEGNDDVHEELARRVRSSRR